MPRLTARWRRTTVTASSMRARSSGSRPAMSPLMRLMSCADPADFLLGRGGCGAGPVVDAAGGGEPFAGAEQVVEVGGQVGQVGDVGAEVVAAGAAEPERAGAAAGR